LLEFSRVYRADRIEKKNDGVYKSVKTTHTNLFCDATDTMVKQETPSKKSRDSKTTDAKHRSKQCGICLKKLGVRSRRAMTCEHAYCIECIETSAQSGYGLRCVQCSTGEVVEDIKFRLRKDTHIRNREKLFEANIWPLEQCTLPTTQRLHGPRIQWMKTKKDRYRVSTKLGVLCSDALIKYNMEESQELLALRTVCRRIRSETSWGKPYTCSAFRNYLVSNRELLTQGVGIPEDHPYHVNIRPQMQILIDRYLALPLKPVAGQAVVMKKVVDLSKIFKCHNASCRGYLDEDSFECTLCHWKNCPTCHVVITDTVAHTCDPNEAKSVANIISTSKPCPNPSCKERIYKIDGCDHMFCVKCYTPFSWTTGEIQTRGPIHNPEYYRLLRELGEVPPPSTDLVPPPLPSDEGEGVVCEEFQIIRLVDHLPPFGGPESPHIPSKDQASFRSIFFELHRRIQEMRDWSISTRVVNYNDETFLDLRIRFLANRISEPFLKEQMCAEWQKMEGNRELKTHSNQTADVLLSVLQTCFTSRVFHPEMSRESLQRVMMVFLPMIEEPLQRLRDVLRIHTGKHNDKRILNLRRTISSILRLVSNLFLIKINVNKDFWETEEFGKRVRYIRGHLV